MVPLISVAVVAAAAAGGPAAFDAVASVDAYRGQFRLLIVFAPTAVNRALAQQREGGDAAEFADRDLRIIEVIGNTVRGATDPAAALRARFDTPPPAFRVILLGKDGHVALDSIGPVPAARIEATIDAMPMRRDEMQRR